jgi:hypothetical protein
MGAGASLDAASVLTKEEVVALAGDQWNESQWEAAQKDEAGRVKAEDLIALAAGIAPVPATTLDGAAMTAAEKGTDEAKARLEQGQTETKLTPAEIIEDINEIWEEKVKNKVPTTSVNVLLKAARQAFADEYLALSEEEQQTMYFQKYCSGVDNFNPYYASLNAALVDGSTALLRADFLERLAAAGQPLGHRAELPPEAFYEGPVFDTHPGNGVVIVAMSYMWATPDHPDPKGEQLKDVAEFLHWIQSTKKDKLVVVMWDWASLYQDKPFSDERPKPWRTDEQTTMFKSGLRHVNLWYCHPNTITLMNRKTPEGRKNGYSTSGWPVSRAVFDLSSSLLLYISHLRVDHFIDNAISPQVFEQGVSQFVKDEQGVIDLHSVLGMLADGAVLERVKKSFGSMARECGKLSKPSPPLSPAAMDIQLSESHFTNGADLAFVYGVYKKTFEAVLGKIKALCFLSMNWVITEEWKAFCHEVIPQCEKLETLFLSGNPDLAVDIVELVAKLPPTLAKLRLDNTGCFGDATKADWARLPALESVGLIGTKITGTEEAIVAAIAAAGCKAAGNVDL